MQRFFVPAAAITETAVTFTSEQAHQMTRVLRLKPRDQVIALDGAGAQHLVTLETVTVTLTTGRILSSEPAFGEPRVRLTLYQALLKGDRWDYVLQKGTEAGIARFVPVRARRCIAQPEGAARRARWQRILTEAAEQSERGIVPALSEPMPLAEALRHAGGLRLFAYERGVTPMRVALARKRPAEISIFVGPEGGFEREEAAAAAEAGAQVISMGPRILRAETAGPALAFAILYARGDFG